MNACRPALFLSLLILASCQSTPTFNFGAYSQAGRFYEKGKYEKAISKYEEFLRENREGNMVVISYYYMAKSYEGLGQTEEARRFYEKIVKKYPKLIWADFSRTRLQELRSQSP